ncbi:MAG TPA: sigma 54-interacting transcriptional regulator [Firmicutes bacterium]|nr:sigma 54-interacting transcriptional regulator [Candidatus Fermentithermobacillaceae bacterium]
MRSKDSVAALLRSTAGGSQLGLTADDVARRIGIDRSTASRYLNELVREGLAEKLAGRPARFHAASCRQHIAAGCYPADLTPIIGYDGSLKNTIRDAQAAVTYPGNRMHCILIGPSGSGKTMIARMIYDFGVSQGVFKPDRFVSFNCADYASTPQLLFSQLYGHVKGAFTGANSEKPGLVDKADGGVLFLDEVHRLPPEGQEMLFSLMDSGCYSRLGSTEQMSADVFVVSATTENVDSSLLTTFLKRFPVVLIVPGFRERPAAERVSLALSFLQQEATRLNQVISVKRKSVEQICSANYPGNVRELRNRIRLSIARAYLRSLMSPGAGLSLSEEDLSIEQNTPVDREIAIYSRAVLPRILVFMGEGSSGAHRGSGEIDICAFINERLAAHRAKGLPDAEVVDLINAELRGLLWTIDASSRRGTAPVEERLLRAVNKALSRLRKEMGKGTLSTAAIWLAAHLSSVVRMVRTGKYDLTQQTFKPANIGETESRIVADLLQDVSQITGVSIPSEEANRLIVLMRSICQDEDTGDRVALASGKAAPRLVVFCLTGENAAQMCKERIVALGVSPDEVCTVPQNHDLVRNAAQTSAIFIGPFNPGIPDDRFIRMDEVFRASDGALRERLRVGANTLPPERAVLVQSVLNALGRSGSVPLTDSVSAVAHDLAERLYRFENHYGQHLDDGLFAATLLHFVASALKGRDLGAPATPVHEFESVMRMKLEPTEIDLLCRVCNLSAHSE